MDKNAIAQEIVNRVEGSKTANYSAWTIGLTHDPKERRSQHEADGKDTQYWLQRVAESLGDAQEIETYFIKTKGMKGGTGGGLSAHRTVYVYIF